MNFLEIKAAFCIGDVLVISIWFGQEYVSLWVTSVNSEPILSLLTEFQILFGTKNFLRLHFFNFIYHNQFIEYLEVNFGLSYTLINEITIFDVNCFNKFY